MKLFLFKDQKDFIGLRLPEWEGESGLVLVELVLVQDKLDTNKIRRY